MLQDNIYFFLSEQITNDLLVVQCTLGLRSIENTCVRPASSFFRYSSLCSTCLSTLNALLVRTIRTQLFFVPFLLFSCMIWTKQVQRAMERILYIWAIRHPASGYVQGINDLMTPLYIVFLSAHVGACTCSLPFNLLEKDFHRGLSAYSCP